MTTPGRLRWLFPRAWRVWIPEPSSAPPHPVVVPALGWVQAGQLGTGDFRRLGVLESQLCRAVTLVPWPLWVHVTQWGVI